VMAGVFTAIACGSSDAHLNPAVTLGFAVSSGQFAKLAPYILAQISGAFVGATLVWLHFLPHWKETQDQGLKLACFCTAPAIRRLTANLISEIIGTFVLVLVVGAIFSKADQQAAQAESRSSLATRLPKTDLVEKSRDAAAAHCRKHGSFVNSRRHEKHEGQSGGMLSVDRVGVRRSEATLVRSFSLENGGPADAYSEFKSSAGRDGRGSVGCTPQLPPLPPAPPNPAHTVPLRGSARHQRQKGTFLIS